ncbi:MAG: PIN domain-containing protein [Candidatus Roizmanbacteria bacterium]|nr:PIN domain-containing protein [Candidatus Roizmanbacteria bacterium]
MYFSLITVGEIYSGKSSPEHEEEIIRLFDMSSMTVIDYELLKSAGEIRRTTHISLIDAIISATALELDLPVATLNVKDFEKVDGLKICSLDEIDRNTSQVLTQMSFPSGMKWSAAI